MFVSRGPQYVTAVKVQGKGGPMKRPVVDRELCSRPAYWLWASVLTVIVGWLIYLVATTEHDSLDLWGVLAIALVLYAQYLNDYKRPRRPW